VEGDIKEIVGALMRVLGGGEIRREEVEDLAFDADGDLLQALNEAYLRLLEFAHDRDMRARLEEALNEIVRLADAEVSSN